MFKNCNNTKRMGDIGEAKAVFEFVKEGLDVFLPVNEFQKADLVVGYNSALFKVQVKTTKTKGPSNKYVVQLKTTGKNSTAISICNREDGDYDFLFVLTDDGDWYLIPENVLPKTSATLNESYDKFKNNFNGIK
jgi:hypothetical protein